MPRRIKHSNKRRKRKQNMQAKNATAKFIPLNPRSQQVHTCIAVSQLVYSYTTSGDYSFSASSDIRYLTFATLAGGSIFSDYSTLYKNVKIIQAAVLVVPFKNGPSTAMGMLSIGCDPNILVGNVANPTNGILNNSQAVRYFSPNSTIVDRATFTWKGIGAGSNLIENISTALDGAFFIGNSGFSYLTSTTAAWDCLWSLQVVFSDLY
jgi:hypothetical protein